MLAWLAWLVKATTGRIGRIINSLGGLMAGLWIRADDSGSITSPAPVWDAESDIRHDRVGTQSKEMSHGEYVPILLSEKKAVQCEGT